MKDLLFVISLLLATSTTVHAGSLESNSDITPKTTRIVGGIKSPLDAWPSTVALLSVPRIDAIESGAVIDPTTGIAIPATEANYQAQVCGASLIATKWVLTAAHCVVNTTGIQSQPSVITALVGTSDLLSGGTRMPIKRIIVHPDYNNASTDSDIALLELVSASSIPTIGFAGVDVPTGTLATTVGWGALDPAASIYPSSLYEVEVPIVNRATCDAIYNSPGSILFTNNMICAGYAAGGKDACQADSGGPLMAIINSGEFVQVGITSWGVGCAQPGLAGVYTRLNNFQGWIDSYIIPPVAASGGGGSFFFLLLPLLLLVSVRPLIMQRGDKHENS